MTLLFLLWKQKNQENEGEETLPRSKQGITDSMFPSPMAAKDTLMGSPEPTLFSHILWIFSSAPGLFERRSPTGDWWTERYQYLIRKGGLVLFTVLSIPYIPLFYGVCSRQREEETRLPSKQYFQKYLFCKAAHIHYTRILLPSTVGTHSIRLPWVEEKACA